MMEAEQLIQEKDWPALTDAELAVVLPLAADEQEFNLLKKMLLVAQAQAEEVPLIGPGVHQRLREAVNDRPHKVFRLPRWGYAAAAAVFVLAVAGWFLLHQASRKPGQAGAPAYVHLDKKPLLTDTSVKATPPPQVVKVAPPSTRPRMHKPGHKVDAPVRLPDDGAAIALTRINTSVGANGRLLDLVAEAY